MATINATNCQMFFRVHPSVLPALVIAIFKFGIPDVQGPCVSAMINIMRDYPRRTLPFLCQTLGTLLETHASSLERLEASFRGGWSYIHWHKINKSKILLIQFRMELATYINDPGPLVRWVAIKAFGQLSAALDPDLQWYIPALALAICDDVDPDVRLAAIDATGQLFTDLGPSLQLQYHRFVLRGLVEAIYDFDYPQVQERAASTMINFSENYPQVDLTPYLLRIVLTLLEERASSRERLELALEDIALEDIEDIALEDIALEDIEDMISDQNQIRASESLLIKFQMELPWVFILAGLLNQEAE